MQILDENSIDQIPEFRARGKFFWLDLVSPELDELERVGGVLNWNHLLIEDLHNGRQRSKIEDFSDHSLVITYATNYDKATDSIDKSEHALVVHGDYLVTVRKCNSIPLEALQQSLENRLAGMSEAAVVHRILDTIVDSTMQSTDTIANKIEVLEKNIDENPAKTTLDELRSCRRNLVTLRALAVAQRDALDSLARALDAIPGFELGMRSHFRDITDHAHRAVDQLEVCRDLLDAAFEAYYATLVAHQGAITQRLTVIATIFLPLTFVTGFFGQNFNWMVEHVSGKTEFLIFGIGTTLATGLLLAILFRKLRWW